MYASTADRTDEVNDEFSGIAEEMYNKLKEFIVIKFNVSKSLLETKMEKLTKIKRINTSHVEKVNKK